MFCYIVYDLIPSENTKVESFDGFINRSIIRFEYEKSPLHTILKVELVEERFILSDKT